MRKETTMVTMAKHTHNAKRKTTIVLTFYTNQDSPRITTVSFPLPLSCPTLNENLLQYLDFHAGTILCVCGGGERGRTAKASVRLSRAAEWFVVNLLSPRRPKYKSFLSLASGRLTPGRLRKTGGSQSHACIQKKSGTILPP